MVFLYNRNDVYAVWTMPYDVWLGNSTNRFQQSCALNVVNDYTTNPLGPFVTYCPSTSYDTVTIKIYGTGVDGNYRFLAFSELEAYSFAP